MKLYELINHLQKKDYERKEYDPPSTVIQRNHLAAHLLHPTPLVAYSSHIHPAAPVLIVLLQKLSHLLHLSHLLAYFMESSISSGSSGSVTRRTYRSSSNRENKLQERGFGYIIKVEIWLKIKLYIF